MATYQAKNLSGALFKNKRKTTDRHPDYTGSAYINGVEFQLSAWLNTSKSGEKYMSLTFQERPMDQGASNPTGPASFDNFDDDIPF